MVGTIKGLGEGLAQAGLGNFVDAQGKMNIKGALMHEGTSASAVVMGIAAQGSIFFDGEGMDRNLTAENVNWATMKAITEGAIQLGSQLPPFFTVRGADDTVYTIFFNGTTFVDLAQGSLGTDLSEAFKAADTITLTQGGLSIVFDFYHA
jgi:hypothetical protein